MQTKKKYLTFIVSILAIVAIVTNTMPIVVLADEIGGLKVANPVTEGPLLCADSAEALGIDIDNTVTLQSIDTYGDLNEYTLISKHFIIDESLYGYIPANITPAAFNTFIDRMDVAYETMSELVSNQPCYGSKIRIQHGGDDSYGYQWVYIGRPNIYWNKQSIESILHNISSNIDDWWFAGTLHELGHVFDDGRYWLYDAEGSATYKAWMVIMKCNNNVIHYNGTIYNNDSFIDFIETQTNEGVGRVFNPVLNENGFEYGWDTLQRVYSSYFDPYYPLTFYKNINETNNEDCVFVDFVDRCSYFLGYDIKELWSENTKTANNSRLDNVTVDDDGIRVVLFPKNARLGEELTYSVYNVEEETTSSVWLQRGGSWYNQHKNKSVRLHVGDNYNMPLGYTLDYESAGNDFIIHVAGRFSNWIHTSTVSGKHEGINLSTVDLSVGDTVDGSLNYQWQSSLDGLHWTDIPAAMKNTYVATVSDWNKLLRCKMTDQQGVTYTSKTTNEVSLCTANISDVSVGSYPKLTFQFTTKPEIFNQSNMYVKIYIDNECVEKNKVKISDQPIGWILSETLLNSTHRGKEIYGEVYFENSTGYVGKVRTPVSIIQ